VTEPKRYSLPEYEQHPLGKMLPPMEEGDFWALEADIQKNGLRDAITLYQGKVLDGWHRYRALRDAGGFLQTLSDRPRCEVEPKFEEFKGDDAGATALVLSKNIYRRHLATAEQRLDLIAKLLKAMPEKSDRQIGEMVKADHHKVGKVRKEEEDVGNIPHVKKRTDTNGRKQPATKGKAEANALVWKRNPSTKESDAHTDSGIYSAGKRDEDDYVAMFYPADKVVKGGFGPAVSIGRGASLKEAKTVAQTHYEKGSAPATAAPPTSSPAHATAELTRAEILTADRWWAVQLADNDIENARKIHALFVDEERRTAFIEALGKAIDAITDARAAIERDEVAK
jgi:hypothetical protein